ncbi:MAG: response regulator transcription factor [Vicinamibacterales bacterium]
MSTPAPANTFRVLVADDHPVVRIGVRNILAAVPEFQIVGECSDGEATLSMVRTHTPDLLLLDLAMPKMSGIEVLRALRQTTATVKTLVLAATVDRRQTLEILQLGARGILLKDVVAERLATACGAVMSGQYWLGDQTVTDIVQAMVDPAGLQSLDPGGVALTARQLQIVKAVVDGCSNKDIAEKLTISEETVKRHLTNIFDKTGMSSRLELAMYAVKHGIGM